MSPLSLFADVDTVIDDALALVHLGMAQRAGVVEVLGCSMVAGNTDV